MIKVIRFDQDDDRAGAGPLRAVRCTVLPELTPSAPYEVVDIGWYTDGDDVHWRGDAVVAHEVVLRGAEWLEQRWRDGDEKFKHIALAHRAVGLSRDQFAERWRNHAGTSGGTTIPDSARGLAYVQNHPVNGDWAYDAVNEVWFDDIDAMRVRVDWFAAIHPRPTTCSATTPSSPYVRPCWFLRRQMQARRRR